MRDLGMASEKSQSDEYRAFEYLQDSSHLIGAVFSRITQRTRGNQYQYITHIYCFYEISCRRAPEWVQMSFDWRSFVEVSILFKSSDNISIKCSVRMSGVQPVCSTQVITSCTSKWSIIIVRWHSHVWMEKIEFIQNTQTCVCGTVCEIARSTETNREKTHLSFSALSNIRTPDNTCTICSSSLRGWRRPTTQSILCSIWLYCHR